MTERLITEEERRESITETMASWALEGMHPTPEGLSEIRAYIAGEIDADEFLTRAVSRHRVN